MTRSVAYSALVLDFVEPICNGIETEDHVFTCCLVGQLIWNLCIAKEFGPKVFKQMQRIVQDNNQRHPEMEEAVDLLIRRKELYFSGYKNFILKIEKRIKPDGTNTIYAESIPADKINYQALNTLLENLAGHDIKKNNFHFMTYQFYIELQETKPLVWRRIVVPADYSFYQLHMAIQGAFGWLNSHLFQFSENGFDDKTCYGNNNEERDADYITIDARNEKINKVFKQEDQHYCYIYDFGDHWQHKLILEKILEKEIDFPYCLEGRGACPPEDVGGIGGYEEMLKAFGETGNREEQRYIQWLGLKPGEGWDAEFCSVREANKRLAMLSAEV